MDNQLTILKRDARGRVRSTAGARAVAVAEYRRNGLSACAFAQMAGISKNTFWNWLHSHGLMQKRSTLQVKHQLHCSQGSDSQIPNILLYNDTRHW
jgi:hypothetical protein